MPLTLLTLPEELLYIVSDLLPFHALCSFSQASRGCHAAAIRRLSQNVFINFDEVTESVRKYTSLLHRYRTWTAVRRLTFGSPYIHSMEGENLLDFPSRLFELGQRSQSRVNDEELLTLATFVRRLEGLADLVLETTSSIPQIFLRDIQLSHPKCRLHMRYHTDYDLHHAISSSDGDKDSRLPVSSIWTRDISADISMRGESQRHNRVWDYIGSFAPTLTEVRFLIVGIGPEVREGSSSCTNREDLGIRSSICSLRSLQVAGYSTLQHWSLYDWSTKTAFSLLQELDLATPASVDAINFLVECDFPALVKLGLVVGFEDNMSNIEPSSQAARRFLCKLPPLANLKISGRMQQDCLESVITHHGVNLKELWLHPLEVQHRLALNENDIRHIATHCRILEKCTLTIVRSQSDVCEITIYRLLGSIPRLTEIALRLDATMPLLLEPEQLGLDSQDDDAIDNYDVPMDSSFDDFDAAHFEEGFGTWLKPRNGHVRLMLVNAAVDQHLARAIFNIISKARQSTGGWQLQRMSVRSVGGANFGSNVSIAYITDVFNEVSRSWQLERTQNEIGEGGVTVSEVPRQTSFPAPISELDPCIEPIFRKIWPGRGDWRSEWKSILPGT